MIFFIAFSVIHIGFFLWVYLYWTSIDEQFVHPESHELKENFSVIIPIRNEAGNILNLLNDLEGQSYPREKFEVIMIDDHSEDNSYSLCADFFKKSTLSHQLIQMDDGEERGKKAAITLGVKSSSFQTIITTDGDCSVGKDWLLAYAYAYANRPSVMITGPVMMQGLSLFANIQAYEFHTLIGIGAASLTSGHPGMCNGANLSYKRQSFLEVNGYERDKHIPSGDDEFLLQRLHQKYPLKVHFLKSPQAVVRTAPKSTLPALLSQRIRWSSKWKFHKSYFIKLMAVLMFLNYLSVLVALVYVILGIGSWYLLFAVLFLRWSAVYNLNLSVGQLIPVKNRFLAALVGEIIYPFFVIFLGLASIFGKYSWKGRQYK